MKFKAITILRQRRKDFTAGRSSVCLSGRLFVFSFVQRFLKSYFRPVVFFSFFHQIVRYFTSAIVMIQLFVSFLTISSISVLFFSVWTNQASFEAIFSSVSVQTVFVLIRRSSRPLEGARGGFEDNQS